MQKIGALFQERVRDLSPPTAGKLVPGYKTSQNFAHWQGLSDLNTVSLPWGAVPPLVGDPTDPHRWFLFREPFFDWPNRFDPFGSDGFQVTATQYNFGDLGVVGHDVRMVLPDADSFDAASAEVDTRLGLIFPVLADGVIEVLVDAVSLCGVHDLRTRDEWGWSETFTEQTNFLSVEVLHPNTANPLLAAMSSLSSTDISTHEHVETLVPSHHYYAVFNSGPVTAGGAVVILVGTRNWEICACNDTGYESSTSFLWAIDSVEVRVH